MTQVSTRIQEIDTRLRQIAGASTDHRNPSAYNQWPSRQIKKGGAK